MPSKGKRSKKRKREEKKLKEENLETSRPPPPEISSFVVVGLNSITRSLESLSQKSKVLKSTDCEKNDAGQDPQSSTSELKGEKHDAALGLQSPLSGAGDGPPDDNERPLNNAAQKAQSPASGKKGEKSDAGQVSPPPVSKAKDNALNNIETPPKDGQFQGTAASKGQSQKSTADYASGARNAVRETKESLIENEHVDHHFSAIFVPRNSQPAILNAYLPQLIATASLSHPELPATRLVQLPNGCDARLCEALGLSRVSFIGLLDSAPHCKSLVDVVRECVSEIEVPWLQEAKKSLYLPIKINEIETSMPVGKKVVA